MTKVAIMLTDELQQFIDRSVNSGSYHNPSEVVANALHALKAQEDFEQGKLASLRKEIAIGTGQADRGEFVEFNAESINAESINAESINAESINAESINAESINAESIKAEGRRRLAADSAE